MSNAQQLHTQQLQRYQAFLAQLKLESQWQHNHSLEFDLKGQLNPTYLLDQLFNAQAGLLTFQEFALLYWQQRGAGLRLEHSRLASILKVQGQAGLKTALGSYAARFASQFLPEMTDQQLQDSLTARLYRTQAGIYTEYHAYLLCAAQMPDWQIIRSTALDRIGVDFRIITPDNQFNIHIYRSSSSSIKALAHKVKNKAGLSAAGVHVFWPYNIHERHTEYQTTDDLENGFFVYRQQYARLLHQSLLNFNDPSEVIDFKAGQPTLRSKAEFIRSFEGF